MKRQIKVYIYAVSHNFSPDWVFHVASSPGLERYQPAGSVWIPLCERTLDFEFSPEKSIAVADVVARLREEQALRDESRRKEHESLEHFIQTLTNAPSA